MLQFIFTTTLSESLNDRKGPWNAKCNGHLRERKSSPSVGLTWPLMFPLTSGTPPCFLFALCTHLHISQNKTKDISQRLPRLKSRGRTSSLEVFSLESKIMQHKATIWELETWKLLYRILFIYSLFCTENS